MAWLLPQTTNHLEMHPWGSSWPTSGGIIPGGPKLGSQFSDQIPGLPQIHPEKWVNGGVWIRYVVFLGSNQIPPKNRFFWKPREWFLKHFPPNDDATLQAKTAINRHEYNTPSNNFESTVFCGMFCLFLFAFWPTHKNVEFTPALQVCSRRKRPGFPVYNGSFWALLLEGEWWKPLAAACTK